MSGSNVIKLTQPGAFCDPLTEILRNGARALLGQAIEAEVAEFLAKHADLKTATGQQRVVRHGHLPEREIMTDGHNQLPKLILGVKFADGIEVIGTSAAPQAAA